MAGHYRSQKVLSFDSHHTQLLKNSISLTPFLNRCLRESGMAAVAASIRFITRRFRSTITRPCVISCNRASRAEDGLECQSFLSEFSGLRYMSNASVQLKTYDKVVRFSFNQLPDKNSSPEEGTLKAKRAKKMSRKAKLNELRFYRLKAKKKMNSPNPEVRIRYKLEKNDSAQTKRKEEWLIEKLRNFETPKAPTEKLDC